MVVLANVADMPPDQVRGLEQYVASGGALMVFLGPNVRPEFYNRAFGPDRESAEGEKAPATLLPLRIESVQGDTRFPVNLQAAEANHPLSQYFEEQKEFTHLHRPLIAFYKYFRVSSVKARKIDQVKARL